MTMNLENNYELGKIPPQAIEMEEVVLGAVLLESEAVYRIIDIITPECFYKLENQKIFKAVLNLFEKNKPIDILTTTEQLRINNELEEIGGPHRVTELTNRIGSSANIEFHAAIVLEKYIKRELIRICSEIQNRSFDDSLDYIDIIDYLQSETFNLLDDKGKKSKHISEISKERIKEIKEYSKKKIEVTGVPTGFKKIDVITSGWQPADLIIIAARPSMGKTSFVTELAKRSAKYGIVIDLYSLEMRDKQIYDKTISTESKIDSTLLRTGKLDKNQWLVLDNIIPELDKLPIFIDDTPALSINDFNAKIRRNKSKHNTGLIIVDYLQLMKSPEAFKKGGRYGEVSDISSKLKNAAKELDIPIIALSQLNRSVESRTGDKRPVLSDLRESGAIEQDADIVMLIHRPEHYNIMQDSKGNSTTNLIELIIAKNRNGHIGICNLWKNDSWTEFYESKTGLAPSPEKLPF